MVRKMRSIVCSVGSLAKDPGEELLPARERYWGSHIQKAREIAQRDAKDFFILSGVHGLVGEDEILPYYDHLLRAWEVSELAQKVAKQLRDHSVDDIHLYIKNTQEKPEWGPYQDAMVHACIIARGTRLWLCDLKDDD